MSEVAVRVIELGKGAVVVDNGTYEGIRAVYIEPVSEPGTVGAKGPDLPLNDVQPGTVVLRIHEQAGADVLAEYLCPNLKRIHAQAVADNLSLGTALGEKEAEIQRLKNSIKAERVMSRLMGIEDGASAYDSENAALRKLCEEMANSLESFAWNAEFSSAKDTADKLIARAKEIFK